eukprot:CAMPEP_0185313606 /NCGR_PEP_ID=MMETSP1363-20130426/36244_1 /TAXON_ID=38817 /ORGANISM="Gephyrocapsa oceanica, Strain RCC1303" /LENGTH=52 /DNA_ID=CAMNT_0027911539 /DNA_START=67 /DNA_END=225 /DNA_ORIENTATION=+
MTHAPAGVQAGATPPLPARDARSQPARRGWARASKAARDPPPPPPPPPLPRL